MTKRVLVVGFGSIGRRHLRILRQLIPDADIRVLRHSNSVLPEYADGVFTHIEDALAFGPHFAVIANPAPMHLQSCLMLAAAGVDLLVEKPLSAEIAGVANLLRFCRERGCILQVAYNLRFAPSLAHFRDLVCHGAVGRVISVRCEIGQYLPNWRPTIDYRDSVSARRELGGGVLLELSHEIDYLRWIFGEFVWVQATLMRQSDLEVDVEDSAHLILGFEADADGRQLIARLDMDFIRHDTSRTCVAIGEGGTLRWDGISGRVERLGVGQRSWNLLFQHIPQPDEPYVAEWRHFLGCVETRSEPLVNGYDGLSVLTIIDAARRAHTSTSRVFITPNGGSET